MHIATTATIEIPRPPDAVFDLATAPATVARAFKGYGPIPGALRAEVVGSVPMAAGVLRRVTNADGSIVDEVITAFERPRRQAYRLVRGLRPPFAWLVREASGEWTFTPCEGGTRVTWHFVFELTSPLAWPPGRVLMVFFRRAMDACLVRIRDELPA